MRSSPADFARFAVVAGLLAALAGCAAPPVRDGALPALPVPAAWSEPAAGAAP
ncbi:MAG: transporter, partial [Burkholderiales bacterium]